MLRGAEKMSFAEIEQEIVRLGTKAKEGALTVEDMVNPNPNPNPNRNLNPNPDPNPDPNPNPNP